MRNVANLRKRVESLEEWFKPCNAELGLDWDRLTQEDRDKIIAAARVEVKYLLRSHERANSSFKFDFTEITAMEQKALDEGMKVFMAHAHLVDPEKQRTESIH